MYLYIYIYIYYFTVIAVLVYIYTYIPFATHKLSIPGNFSNPHVLFMHKQFNKSIPLYTFISQLVCSLKNMYITGLVRSHKML